VCTAWLHGLCVCDGKEDDRERIKHSARPAGEGGQPNEMSASPRDKIQKVSGSQQKRGPNVLSPPNTPHKTRTCCIENNENNAIQPV
jgi:hypothetical protein